MTRRPSTSVMCSRTGVAGLVEKWATHERPRHNRPMMSIRHLDGPFWAFLFTGALVVACAGLLATAMVAI